jgi:2-polyprenyl-6-hydroxyphenyl methylase/3-demethylubiquinone-9 3-methyltransferase
VNLSTSSDVIAAHRQHASEIASGERFAFGSNWARFLSVIDEQRIRRATSSLQEMLQCRDLDGKAFLDIGSGSGLFSLAARGLGARVHSFDYDPESVACAMALKRRYFPDDPSWTIESGSVLDAAFIRRLGHFDVVYSWGVLHHTGSMWKAIEHAMMTVAPDGKLCIAIYNDMGRQSARWQRIKQTYGSVPEPLKPLYAIAVSAPTELRAAARALINGRPQDYMYSWTRYERNRGMSRWHDIVDWVGGYPYEYATIDAVVAFAARHGLSLVLAKPGGGLGCNEFVFKRSAAAPNRESTTSAQ